jgi:NTP pyrophosphatase (non-canonical NTP hydrolase)
MNTVHDKIRQWGIDKGLTGPQGKATVAGQMRKLEEEFDELDQAIGNSRLSTNTPEAADAIGDITVVLVLLCELLHIRYEDCVQGAYDTIATRTGRMKDGIFVKDTESQQTQTNKPQGVPMNEKLRHDRSHLLDAIESVRAIPQSDAVAYPDKQRVLTILEMWLRSMDNMLLPQTPTPSTN